MNSRAAVVVGALAVILIGGQAMRAQMTMQPTARPIVTAENEAWYLAGVPITVAGMTYHPAGPMVHFNANEMVRGGHFQGIPLYSRTTIEPYSVIFVPLAGGLMHPYERRRDGDLTGTVGSGVPSFPVVRDVERAGMDYAPGAGIVQAPAPPTQLGEAVDRIALADIPPSAAPAAVGTTGVPAVTPAGPLVTARRPQGLNGVFIEYDSQRYFSAGPAVAFDAARFTRVGEYRGFPVYQQQGEDRTLYLPALGGAPTVVAPYRAR
jgi:hypothetical protein